MKLLETTFVSLPRLIIGALMLAMVAINFANVVGRHAFNQPIFWSEEIMVLLLIWGVFIGAVAVTFKGRHLRMDLFSTSLKEPWVYVVNVAVTLVFVGMAGYAAYYSYQVVSFMASIGRVSNAAKYPIAIQHAAVFVGLVLIVVAVIVRLRSYLAGKFD